LTPRGDRRRAGWMICAAAHAGCLAAADPPSTTEARSDLDDLAGASELVTWTCTASPCPWGDSLANPAIAWPDRAGPVATRLGYTASPAPYLPAVQANGVTIAIDAGSASLYAGAPANDAHRWITTLVAGESYAVAGLGEDEVLSVQSDADFSYHTQTTPPPPPGIDAIAAFWRCNIPECTGEPWTGAVIGWPDWAAYQNNARAGDQSRSVFAGDGTPLYPYMAAWADGCEVTALAGTVLIIEWQRGADSWRETPLQPGESHTIQLLPPEDGAMIETEDGMTSFRVSLQNCNPQPLPE
jgi:hypothetical protein